MSSDFDLNVIMDAAQDAVDKLDALVNTIEEELPSCDDCDYDDESVNATVHMFTEASEAHNHLSGALYFLRNERERVRNADDD